MPGLLILNPTIFATLLRGYRIDNSFTGESADEVPDADLALVIGCASCGGQRGQWREFSQLRDPTWRP